MNAEPNSCRRWMVHIDHGVDFALAPTLGAAPAGPPSAVYAD